jgi:hypothetical protein
MVMGIATDLLDGTISVELEPAPTEVHVVVSIEMQSRGFMAGLLFPVISTAVANGFEETANRFIASLGRVA